MTPSKGLMFEIPECYRKCELGDKLTKLTELKIKEKYTHLPSKEIASLKPGSCVLSWSHINTNRSEFYAVLKSKGVPLIKGHTGDIKCDTDHYYISVSCRTKYGYTYTWKPRQ